MKRLLMGSAVLLALLLVGIVVSMTIVNIHMPIAAQLQAAADAVEAGNWSEAVALAQDANDRWDAWRHFTAAFTDHAPMDELDVQFAQLEVELSEKNASVFRVICVQLSQLTQALADSHRLRWWTFL